VLATVAVAVSIFSCMEVTVGVEGTVVVRLMIQLDQLKKETLEAKALVSELQKSQESWLRRDSRLAMEHSLRSLRPKEQE